MRRAIKIGAILTTILLAVGGATVYWAYRASQHVPEFYSRAVALDAGKQTAAHDEFVAETTALASDLRRRGRWQHLFTAEQINAWLALELSANYPEMLAGELRDPRVELGDHQATIACRYENGDLSTVLSLTVDAYLHEPNVLALRVLGARAGSLPVPLAQVLDAISHAARQLKLRLEWRKADGDPVALITFPQPRDSQSNALRLETVELRKGELYVAGTRSTGGDDSHLADGEKAPDGDAAAPEAQPRIGSAAKDTRQE